MKRVVFALVALLAAVAVSALSLATKPTTADGTNKRIEILSRCLSDLIESATSSSKDAGFQRCADEVVSPALTRADLISLLDAIFAARRNSPTIELSCHDILHAVGVSADRSLGTSAFIPGAADCGFGFYHGLMRSAAERLDPESSYVLLGNFCTDLARSTPDEYSATLSFCAHGIGHALGQSVEITKGYGICLRYGRDVGGSGGSADFVDEGVVESCFSGVLNEKLRYEYFAGTAPVTVGDALHPCTAITGFGLRSCVAYALHYSSIDLDTLRTYCASAPQGEVLRGCWQAVGFRANALLFESPKTPRERELVRDFAGQSVISRPDLVLEILLQLCAGDPGTDCVERFVVEVVQSTQRPSFVLNICEQLGDAVEADRCRAVLGSVSAVQGR